MTNYLPIPDSDIDPESPIDTSLETRLRDNLVAAFEGDPIAPKLAYTALQEPTAGTTYLLKTIQTAEFGTTADSYLATGFHDRFDGGRHLGFSCLLSGVVTVQVEHHCLGGDASVVRVLKNEIEIIEWTTTSSTYVQQTYDLAISAGDAIIMQHKAPDQQLGWWQNLQVYSGTQSIAVA
jgi:hypothetical protein